MVKAPIPLFGIAGDYAGALYSAAVKASLINQSYSLDHART